ncbi:MAG: hypothetical protein J3K34DRAFT_406328 [Monoraphidium minutum]|nr:MAG: hypothetical protein J3K34DRAFT_406328 [Monoraphidium minutum]
MGEAPGPGWAPMGARLLTEFGQEHPDALANEAAGRYQGTWRELIQLPSLKALVGGAAAHMRLLHAVDAFPRGGLCQGAYLKEALRRYEDVWLPLLSARRLAGQPWQDLVPPLDVAFVWHLHRLSPSLYAADCQKLPDAQGQVLHVSLQQAFQFTDGTDAPGAASAAAWRAAHPREPFWPPRCASPYSRTSCCGSSTCSGPF